METAELERLMADALGPRVDVSVRGSGPRRNRFRATIESTDVEVEWLNLGWPRQVQEMLDRPDHPDVVVARELSPGAIELLRGVDLSWVDLRGAADIHLNGLLIFIRSEARSPAPKGALVWTPATLAASEALLDGTPGTVAEIVEATGMSPSTSAGALKVLQKEGLLIAQASRGRNARRSVVNKGDLLEAYAATAARLRSLEATRVGVMWRNPVRGARDLGQRLSDIGVPWSVTGALAADMLAPLLTEAEPWEMYVDGRSAAELRQIAREAGLRELAGGRLLLRPFPTPAKDRLSTRVDGVALAAWPRVFSDLRMTGVRGEEAAEHLREHMEARP